jgi:hypothetical protein
MAYRGFALFPNLLQRFFISMVVKPKVRKVRVVQNQCGALQFLGLAEPVVPFLVVLENSAEGTSLLVGWTLITALLERPSCGPFNKPDPPDGWISIQALMKGTGLQHLLCLRP